MRSTQANLRIGVALNRELKILFKRRFGLSLSDYRKGSRSRRSVRSSGSSASVQIS